MDRLLEEYGTEIEFIDLNVDDPATAAQRSHYGLSGRSQYVLVDAQDTIIERWFGPLHGDRVAASLEAFLAGN